MPAIDSTIVLICDICPSSWATRKPWAWISGVRDPVPLSTVGWGSSGPSGDRDRSRTSSAIAQTTGREPVGSATINKSETLIGPGLFFQISLNQSELDNIVWYFSFFLWLMLEPQVCGDPWLISALYSWNSQKNEILLQNCVDFQNPFSELGFNNSSNSWLSCYVSQLHFRKFSPRKKATTKQFPFGKWSSLGSSDPKACLQI